jgi:RNA polymerase sigma factor (sigma-70 family)
LSDSFILRVYTHEVKMTDCQTWLAEYAKSGSESAFRELVARYIDLVYCTALRLVGGDTHLAQDVAQLVFVDLARKASTLPGDLFLGGWLYRDTCFVAGKIMRGERRRQARERQAAEMNTQPDHSAANLAKVVPILDEAISELGATDRAAILLRFFEQRDFRSVGLALGSNEDTAQKRVSRALEKLRSILKHRGLNLSAAALGTALAAQAVTAAPAGLAASISATALAQAAAGGGIALTFLKPFLKLMAMSKLTFGIIAAVVVAGLAVPVVVHYQSRPAPPKEDLTSAQPGLDVPSGGIKPDSETATPSPPRLPIARSVPTAPAQAAVSFRAMDEIMKGMRLTAAQAQEMESKLAQVPDDLSARCQLLGYYSSQQFRSQAAREARQGHIQWLIQHQPELNLGAYANLDPRLDGAAYAQAKALWLQQVNDNPQNTAILGHAAQFCLLNDRPTAEELLQKAQALEPANPAWYSQMAHLYALDAKLAEPGSSNQPAVKALEQMERAQANTTGEMEKFENLNQLTQMAFDAGEGEKARTYATALLQQASEQQTGWNYGDAIYRGNAILGRLALRGGNLEEAKQYLLAAARTTGSPVLNSFGPNMALAKELLQQGEKDTVLEYFKLCGKFWQNDKIAAWTEQVNQGSIPDFGANLVY